MQFLKCAEYFREIFILAYFLEFLEFPPLFMRNAGPVECIYSFCTYTRSLSNAICDSKLAVKFGIAIAFNRTKWVNEFSPVFYGSL